MARAVAPLQSKPGYVRVRIAVAVGHDGTWVADGRLGYDDVAIRAEMSDYCAEWVKNGHVVFVEADVPLPTTITVHAKDAQ